MLGRSDPLSAKNAIRLAPPFPITKKHVFSRPFLRFLILDIYKCPKSISGQTGRQIYVKKRLVTIMLSFAFFFVFNLWPTLFFGRQGGGLGEIFHFHFWNFFFHRISPISPTRRPHQLRSQCWSRGSSLMLSSDRWKWKFHRFHRLGGECIYGQRPGPRAPKRLTENGVGSRWKWKFHGFHRTIECRATSWVGDKNGKHLADGSPSGPSGALSL